jgi:hypothetical protein
VFAQPAQVRGHACRSPNGAPQKEQWEFLIAIVTVNETSVPASAALHSLHCVLGTGLLGIDFAQEALHLAGEGIAEFLDFGAGLFGIEDVGRLLRVQTARSLTKRGHVGRLLAMWMAAVEHRREGRQ